MLRRPCSFWIISKRAKLDSHNVTAFVKGSILNILVIQLRQSVALHGDVLALHNQLTTVSDTVTARTHAWFVVYYAQRLVPDHGAGNIHRYT